MKWLEKLAENNLIRPEVYQKILSDVEVVKTAALSEKATALMGDIGAIAKNALIFMGVSAAANAGKNLANKVLHKTTEDKILNHIKNNAQSIAMSPEFAKDKQKAVERYRELCGISINIAMNLPLAKAIVLKHLYNGFSNEDIIRLSTLQTISYTPSSHISESTAAHVRPHIMGKIAADVYLLRKQASFDKIKPSLGLMSTLAGTSLLLGGIGAGVGYLADKIKGKNLQDNLKKSYDQAVAKSELLQGKPDEAREAFKTLSHFAPHVALEPNAARTFMTKIIAYGVEGGSVDVNDIKALSDIHKNYNATKQQSGAARNFKGMFNMTGGSKAVEGINESLGSHLTRDIDSDVATDINTDIATNRSFF